MKNITFDKIRENIDRLDFFSVKFYTDQAIRSGFDINTVEDHGWTLLIFAVSHPEKPNFITSFKQRKIISYLLKKGINVNIHVKKRQYTALHVAAQDNRADVVKLLLEYGADGNAKDVFGNTPLWIAIYNCKSDFKIIKLLCDYGADPKIKNKENNSPLDLARNMGRQDLTNILSFPLAGL